MNTIHGERANWSASEDSRSRPSAGIVLLLAYSYVEVSWTDLVFQAPQLVMNRSIILKCFGLGIGNIVILRKHGQGLGR